MDPLLYLLLGIALGGVIGWLLGARLKLGRSDTPPATPNPLEAELRQQLMLREGELEQARGQINEACAARATAEASRAASDEQLAESKHRLEIADAEVKAIQEQLNGVRASLASTEANAQATGERLTQQHETHVEQRNLLLRAHEEALAELREQLQRGLAGLQAAQEELLTSNGGRSRLEAEVKFLNERLATERQQAAQMQEKFLKDFEAISNKLLVDNTNKFNQQSADSLGKLLTPLRESLGEFKISLDSTRNETAAHSALLKDQVGRIGAEAASLAKALKGDAKVLGNWGENMLEQILKLSGLQPDTHYWRQLGAKDAEGDQRFLDVVIKLPEDGSLVVDSKVSLRSYEAAVNATEDESRNAHLDRHVEAIRAHYRGLGGKRYQDLQGLKTPDYVLMYVPIEAAYFTALAREPGLFGEALVENVVIITNSTLLATLRTVASVWKLAVQQKNAQSIAERGGRLYDKFVGFVTDLQKVGDALGGAQRAFEDANNKLHTGGGNLVRQAEQMKALGARASRSLPSDLVEKAGAGESAAAPPAAP